MQHSGCGNNLHNTNSSFCNKIWKSWYIAVFQLPMVAAMLWHIFKPEQSRNVVVRLERHTDIA